MIGNSNFIENRFKRQGLIFAIVSLCLLLSLIFAYSRDSIADGSGDVAVVMLDSGGSAGEVVFWTAESDDTGKDVDQDQDIGQYGDQDARQEMEKEKIPLAGFGKTVQSLLKPKLIPQDWEFTIIATGDVMMHSPQISAGWISESRSYDFAFMFEKVAPILRQGDLVICNLETTLAGEANEGFTGYPRFNAPEILAKNLKDVGFTLVSTANNHILDRGHRGLLATLDHLDEAGLLHTGAFRSPEERSRTLLMDVKGVKVAAIAATYGTNGLSPPSGHGYAVSYIDEAELLEDIRRAKGEGADYIIVMLHWGDEYQPRPNQAQTILAENLLRGGADFILGNHPHVLQRGEALRIDGSHDKFVMYSLGNFVSNQEGMERLSSMLLVLTIGVSGITGEPYFKEAGYIPIYTQKRNNQGVSHHIVWPLELALAELEAGGQAFGWEDRTAIPRAWNHVVNSQPDLKLLMLKDTPLWEELGGSVEEAHTNEF